MISQPDELWNKLIKSETEESKPEFMQRNYYYPLLGIMALVVFVCAGLRGPESDTPFDIQHGMTKMVPVLVAYFVGPYLALFLVKEGLIHFFGLPNPDKARLSNFVFYSMSFLMALEMVLAVFPAILFFRFIALYLIYITWNGSHTYIRVEERRRWIFGFYSAVVIYFSPGVIETVLERLQG